MRIYHNPRCSKSREALALIRSKGIEPEIIEYLKNPPSKEELKDILKLLKLRPRDIIRVKEDQFASLNLDLELDEKVLTALVQFPELLERPIIVHGKKAVLARPPELVEQLF